MIFNKNNYFKYVIIAFILISTIIYTKIYLHDNKIIKIKQMENVFKITSSKVDHQVVQFYGPNYYILRFNLMLNNENYYFLTENENIYNHFKDFDELTITYSQVILQNNTSKYCINSINKENLHKIWTIGKNNAMFRCFELVRIQ